ncbi:MAG: hypothetical protein Q9170_005178 [Blastenia crenularia]
MTPDQYLKGHSYGVSASYGESMLHAGDVNGNIVTTNNYEQQQQSKVFSNLPAEARNQKLLEFARTGQESRLKQILRPEVDLEHRSPVGNTALHEALFNGKSECARHLITHGSNVNSDGENAYTPLNISAEDNDQETVTLLLKNGANIETHDVLGLTPIMKAARGGYQSMVCDLVKRHANVKRVDNYGWTALLYAANNGHHDVVRDLCTYSSDLERKGPDGRTALMRAALEGYANVVALLLRNGANPHVTTHQGWTPMLDAADCGHWPVAQNLLVKRPNLEARGGSEGWIALLRAAYKGHINMVALLLKVGANPQTATRKGWTSLHLAAYREDLAVSEDFLDCQSNLESSVGSERWTALIQAPESGHANVVALLLNARADPNATTQQGWTALMVAAWKGSISVVEELLRNKSGVNYPDRMGRTALMWAAQKGNYDVAQKLLDNGADAVMEDIDGRRADETAFHSGKAELAEMLREIVEKTKLDKVSYRLELTEFNE